MSFPPLSWRMVFEPYGVIPSVFDWSLIENYDQWPQEEHLVVLYLAGSDMGIRQFHRMSSDFWKHDRLPEFLCNDDDSSFRNHNMGVDLIIESEQNIANLTSRNPLATRSGKCIASTSLYILRSLIIDACVVLQPLQLPSLMIKTIVQEFLCDSWPNIVDYHYNLIVEAVKHFHDPPDHPTKRRRLPTKEAKD